MQDNILVALVIDSLIKQAVGPIHTIFPTPNDIFDKLKEKKDESLVWIEQLLKFIINENQNDTPLCILLPKCDTSDLMKQDFMENVSNIVNEYRAKEYPTRRLVLRIKANKEGAKKAFPKFLLKFNKLGRFGLTHLKTFINLHGLKYDKKYFPGGIKTNIGSDRSMYDILNDLCNLLGVDNGSTPVENVATRIIE